MAGENRSEDLAVTPCEVFSGNGKPGLPVKAAKCRDISLNKGGTALITSFCKGVFYFRRKENDQH